MHGELRICAADAKGNLLSWLLQGDAEKGGLVAWNPELQHCEEKKHTWEKRSYTALQWLKWSLRWKMPLISLQLSVKLPPQLVPHCIRAVGYVQLWEEGDCCLRYLHLSGAVTDRWLWGAENMPGSAWRACLGTWVVLSLSAFVSRFSAGLYRSRASTAYIWDSLYMWSLAWKKATCWLAKQKKKKGRENIGECFNDTSEMNKP